LSRGSFMDDEADVPAVPDVLVAELPGVVTGSSIVPLISTLWPTWEEIFESSVSRRYRLAVVDDVVPDVPLLVVPPPVVLAVLPLDDIVAFASIQRVIVPLVPVVPAVPAVVSVAAARSTHPVIFTSLAVSDGRVVCEPGVGVCAASPTAKPAATHVATTMDRFISTSLRLRRVLARKLCAAPRDATVAA